MQRRGLLTPNEGVRQRHARPAHKVYARCTLLKFRWMVGADTVEVFVSDVSNLSSDALLLL